MSELEPLDPALAETLRQASIPAPPEGAHERLLGRLSLVLPAATPGVSAPVTHPRAGSALAGAGAVSAKGAAVIAVAFLAGGAAGAAAAVSWRPSEPPRVVYVDRVVSAPPPGSATAPSPGAVAPEVAAPPALRTSPATSTGAPVPSATQGELPSERLLIDEARAGLASGDAAVALARLDEHAHRYKHGQLDEEREALAVQALASSAATTTRARAPRASGSGGPTASIYRRSMLICPRDFGRLRSHKFDSLRRPPRARRSHEEVEVHGGAGGRSAARVRERYAGGRGRPSARSK